MKYRGSACWLIRRCIQKFVKSAANQFDFIFEVDKEVLNKDVAQSCEGNTDVCSRFNSLSHILYRSFGDCAVSILFLM